ncbi:MAG TPA: hypothetical protein DCP31_23940 [Cyanobacteria bacterium UBA8543]|nr:hypothetical protein [Cyanobacteria bacterium UBA8543]
MNIETILIFVPFKLHGCILTIAITLTCQASSVEGVVWHRCHPRSFPTILQAIAHSPLSRIAVHPQ